MLNRAAARQVVLFGLTVDAITLPEAVDRAEHAIRTRSRLLVGVVNAAKIVKLTADGFLRASLLEADLVLADGQSVVWASRLLRRPLPERVTGIDLFEALLALAAKRGYRVFFLGARPEVLTAMEAQARRRWPGLIVAGRQHGYFPTEQTEQVAEAIRASRPDMLFIGMATPAKELFLGTYADRLGATVLHGVGGSFDVLAGVTERAPEAWQRAGMEWAYRLRQEPRRLWKRYLVTNTAFLLLLLVEAVSPRAPYPQPAPDRHPAVDRG
jgi:N-acetylglucosaminyldiphosphoundecaprenol N-acetyl-beta-D-mannosaminyltransferase